jgi:hypothetical protein
MAGALASGDNDNWSILPTVYLYKRWIISIATILGNPLILPFDATFDCVESVKDGYLWLDETSRGVRSSTSAQEGGYYQPEQTQRDCEGILRSWDFCTALEGG